MKTPTYENLLAENKFLQNEIVELQKRANQFEKQLSNAHAIILELKKENEMLCRENKKLEKENEKLHKQLRKFLNENTPSGSVPPYLKDELEAAFPPENTNSEKKEREGKQTPLSNKRNKRPKPQKKKRHTIKKCPCCGKELKPLQTERTRIVIHLKLPKAEAVEHISEGGYCPECKKRFYAPVPDTLPNSKYSLDIAIFIVTLSVVFNMSQRKIAELLDKFGVPISPASVNNVYHNVRKYLGEKKYREFEQELRKSMNTHVDETSHRHKGKNRCTLLVGNAKTIFIRIAKARDTKTVKKLPLGKYTNCDGYRAYDKVDTVIQRCWAKVSRKARNPEYGFSDEEEVKQYKTFVSKLFKIYHDAKHTKERGEEVRRSFDIRLRKLLMKPRKEERNLLRLMNYILEYEGEWFTFLLRKGIAPTNNFAEQQLRPLVIKRKISQHTWSESGQRSLEVFYSLAQTCKLRKENFADLVRNEIEANLAEMRKS